MAYSVKIAYPKVKVAKALKNSNQSNFRLNTIRQCSCGEDVICLTAKESSDPVIKLKSIGNKEPETKVEIKRDSSRLRSIVLRELMQLAST